MRTLSVRSIQPHGVSGRRAARVLALAAFLITGSGAPRAVDAADPAPQGQLSDHEKRIQELEDTINRLKKDERQLEVNVENQKPLAGWSDGFNLASQDGAYKLKVGGYTQADGRFFIDDAQNRNTSQFTFRRARIDLQGTVAKYFNFRVLPDFAGSKAVLFDAYLDFNYIPEAVVRVGKFKPPVGLERLQSATSLTFLERGQPTNLVPNRDNGVQLYGSIFGGAFAYQLGVFDGVPDGGNGDGDTNDDKDFAGRVFAVPFKNLAWDVVKGLGFGVAGSYGREKGSPTSTDLPTFKTFGQSTYFQYKAASSSPDATNTVVAAGNHSRISPQANFYWGPFGFLGEYVTSEQTVSLKKQAATLSNDAWALTASYVVTGEAASYVGVVPARPFNPFDGTWGALELAARYGELYVDPDAFRLGYADPKKSARSDHEWVIGANWYLNKNVKLVLDYANSSFDGGTAGGNRTVEQGLFTRAQLAF